MRISPDGEVTNCYKDGYDAPVGGSARCLLALDSVRYLVGTRHNGMLLYDSDKRSFKRYAFENKGYEKLPSNYVTEILRTSKGEIWIATMSGGLSLFDPDKGIVKSITAKDGLESDEISALIEDCNGDLWYSSNNSVSCYSPSTGKARLLPVNNLGSFEFSPHSAARLPDGTICFSTSNGYLSFAPDNVLAPRKHEPLVFTGLSINNKPIVPGDESNVLPCVLDDVSEPLELNHTQTNIALSFSYLDYDEYNNVRYFCRLQGNDDNWIDIGNRTEVFYNNLSPGHYIFEVKAADGNGEWLGEARRIEIHIAPPLWATWYAYLFYALVFFGTCYALFYYLTKKKELELKLLHKSLEQQQAEEFHQSKINMFTNFSHELRTPLMLIASPLEHLLSIGELPLYIKNKLNLIHNNTQRLLLLVNQLLDLRKSESGKLRISVSKDEMCSFMQEIHSAFNQIATTRGIKFDYNCNETRIAAWFDKSLIEKVMFNLLSNAMKYTPDNGHVTLTVNKINRDGLPPQYVGALPECSKYDILLLMTAALVFPRGRGTAYMTRSIR